MNKSLESNLDSIDSKAIDSASKLESSFGDSVLNSTSDSTPKIVAIYGDVAYKLDENSLKIPKKYANPKYRMPFCHQAVFVKTSLLKKYKFDTSFKICADNDFFTKIYHLGYKFHKVEQIISLYDAYGVSSRPNLRFFYEELKIAQKYNKFYFLIFIPKYLFMVLKYAIKSLLPRKLSILIQKNYNAK